jgi:hypothetical protein
MMTLRGVKEWYQIAAAPHWRAKALTYLAVELPCIRKANRWI